MVTEFLSSPKPRKASQVTVQKRSILPENIVGHSSADGATTPDRDPFTDAPTGLAAPVPSQGRSSADSDYDERTAGNLAAREAEYRAAQRNAYGEANGITQDTSGAGYPLGGE